MHESFSSISVLWCLSRAETLSYLFPSPLCEICLIWGFYYFPGCEMESQWVCRNALSGAIPKGGSSLASSSFYSLGRSTQSISLSLGQRQQWMGGMIKRPSNFGRFVHISATSTASVTKDGSWHRPFLFWIDRSCVIKRCPMNLKGSLHGWRGPMVYSRKNYTVSKGASCPVGAPALTSFRRRFQMEPGFFRVVFCSMWFVEKQKFQCSFFQHFFFSELHQQHWTPPTHAR